MMEKTRFLAVDIRRLLGEIDGFLERKVELMMIGGGAMSVRGDKASTKDIDMVFRTESQMEDFISALERGGFHEHTRPGLEYRKMSTRVFVDGRGYWLDLFCERICKAFFVHEAVWGRAEEYLELSRLRVVLMAPEDIFISKSITERDGDLDDMYTMFRNGLDEELVLKEVAFQTEQSPKIWEAFLTVKLEELEKKFDINVPFKNRVMRIAEDRMERLAKKG
jgi:hypothetical protein